MSNKGFLGTFSSLVELERSFPASAFPGRGALIGEALSVSQYFSTGSVWQEVGVAGGATGIQSVVLTPSMTGEQVRAAIQTQLDGGYKEILVWGNGVFELGNTLVMDDDTTLRIMPGCTIKWPAGLKSLTELRGMIENRAKPLASTAITVAAVAHVATVGWPAHGKSVGDAVLLHGSATRGYNGAYLVASVVDANTFTVLLERTPAATPAVANTYFASVMGKTANKNIRLIIDGTLDGNGVNNMPVSNDVPTMGVAFSSVFNTYIKGSGAVVDTLGYAMTIAGGTQCGWDAEWLRINNPRRDGCHFQGPIRRGRISKVYGYSYDDFTSLTTGDYELGMEMSEGEFEDVIVEDVFSENPQTGGGAAIFGKTRWWFGDITYRRVRCKADIGAVFIKRLTGRPDVRYNLDKPVFVGSLKIDDCGVQNRNESINYVSLLLVTGDPTLKTVEINSPEMIGTSVNFCRLLTFNRTAGDWTVDNVVISNFKTNNGGPQILIGGAAGVTIGKLSIKDSSPHVAQYGTAFSTGGMTIREMLLDNVTPTFGGLGCTLLGLTSGTVDHVTLRNCTPSNPNNGSSQLVYWNACTVRTLTVEACSNNGNALVWGDTAVPLTNAPVLKLSGNHVRANCKNVILNVGIKILVDQHTENTSGTVYDLRGAGQVYDIVEDATLNSASTAPFAFTGGATANLFAQQRRVDITQAGLNRVNGGAAWNTNAAAGTLGTAGPVVGLGTAAGSWKRLGDFSLSY